MTGQPKRILFARAADTNNFNAQAKNVQNILAHWRSTAYRPSVFAFGKVDPRVAANPNVDIIRLQNGRLWRAQVFASYFRNFDAVFCPGIHHFADWLALRLRAAIGVPLPIISTVEGLLSAHADDEYERRYAAIAGHKVFGQQVPAAYLRRGRWIRQNAAHIIAISPFLARQVGAEFADKVSVLPLGVDVELFRRSSGVRRERPRVVCAGNVRAHKRPEVFLTLARRFPSADFAWFGEGDLRHILQSQARDESLANLSFPGAVPPPALAREFASADIMVLPSNGEGVPKVTQEAAAAGLAQIIFGFYEAPTVVDGRNGFVVWSDAELIARLSDLLDNTELVERMGRAAEEMARSWAWSLVAPLWEERIVTSLETAGADPSRRGHSPPEGARSERKMA